MDQILKVVIEGILDGSKEVILGLGWVLYLVERYYLHPKREILFRKELGEFRSLYREFTEKMGDTLGNFATVLEVVKDRMR